jgi:hypothetical protein
MSTNGTPCKVTAGGTMTHGHVDWSGKIRATWRAAVASIIETGQLLIRAKAELPHGAFGKMIREELPFSRFTAHRLMAIARNPALVAHAQHLPPSWMALSYLARLPEGEVEKKIADGSIHPGMQRKHAMEILRPVQQTHEPVLVWTPSASEERAPPPRLSPKEELRIIVQQISDLGGVVPWLNELPKPQRVEFIRYMIAALDLSVEDLLATAWGNEVGAREAAE